MKQELSPKYITDLTKKVADAIWSEFKSYEMVKFYISKWRKVEYNEEDWTLSKELIRTQLTAMIAQRLFSTTEFYRVMNPRENEPYKKALEILHAWNEQGEQILLGQ